MTNDDMVISDAEWQAALAGASVMRQAARDFRTRGNEVIAAQWDGHAEALMGLARRATVAATRDQQAGENELEAER